MPPISLQSLVETAAAALAVADEVALVVVVVAAVGGGDRTLRPTNTSCDAALGSALKPAGSCAISSLVPGPFEVGVKLLPPIMEMELALRVAARTRGVEASGMQRVATRFILCVCVIVLDDRAVEACVRA